MQSWNEIYDAAFKIEAMSDGIPKLSALVTRIKHLLINRTMQEIEYAIDLNKANIDIYFEQEINDKFNELKELSKENENLKQVLEFPSIWNGIKLIVKTPEFFISPTAKEYMIEHMELDTPEKTSNFEALEKYISIYGIDLEDEEFLNGYEYEFMAAFALDLVLNAISAYDEEYIKCNLN